MRIKSGLKLRKVGRQYMIAEQSASRANETNVYTLNATAAYLWERLEGRDFDEDMMGALLCEKYEIDMETATNDAAILIRNWKELGLITDN